MGVGAASGVSPAAVLGSPTEINSWALPGAAVDVAVAGDTLFVSYRDYSSGETDGISIYDVSVPTAPTLLSAMPLDESPKMLDYQNDRLYGIVEGVGVVIYDVTDRSNPTTVGVMTEVSSPSAVEVRGDRAYVADYSGNVRVFDVSGPAPVAIDQLGVSGSPASVAVCGDRVYVAARSAGVHVLDVSPDGELSLAYTWQPDAGDFQDAVVQGDTVYAVDLLGEFYALDVRAASSASILGSVAMTDVSCWSMCEAGGIIYAACGGTNSGIYPIDVSDPSNPIALAHLSSANISYNVAVSGGEVYVAAHSQGLLIGDVDYLRGAMTQELYGGTRYETAARISEAAYPRGAARVVLTTGRNWPDALGGAALAGAYDAPILLCDPGSLPAATAAEITRLGAKQVTILGGTVAVTDDVRVALESLMVTGTVTRVEGASRYGTAQKVAQAAITELGSTWSGTAFVATGADFPDALAASPLSAYAGWPIYLAAPGELPPTAVMEAAGVTDVLVLGGEIAISDTQMTALEGTFGADHVDRLQGVSRYETALAIARFGITDVGLEWDRAAFASGQNFPDALSGGALQGARDSVLLLTRTDSLPSAVSSALSVPPGEISSTGILGGPSAVSQQVRDAIWQSLD
jgi:putative cell wall-binding protein